MTVIVLTEKSYHSFEKILMKYLEIINGLSPTGALPYLTLGLKYEGTMNLRNLFDAKNFPTSSGALIPEHYMSSDFLEMYDEPNPDLAIRVWAGGRTYACVLPEWESGDGNKISSMVFDGEEFVEII